MIAAEILILAIALSLDALIVCFSFGTVLSSERLKNSCVLALSFGFFQFLMPVIGWYLSSLVYSYLQIFSKWIVFTIFILLAIKFLQSAFSKEEVKINCISILCILWLAIATSIDAMGAGISLRFINVSIIMPAILIGIVTLFNSFIGFWIAVYASKKFNSRYIEITGAILLLYLAFKSII